MARPEIFTVTFWQVTVAQVVHSAAGGALTALGIGGIGVVDPSTHFNVPGYGVLIGAGIGGLTALLLALAGKANPESPPGALFNIPGPKPPE